MSSLRNWESLRGQLAKKLGIVTVHCAADCFDSLAGLDDDELQQFLESDKPEDAVDYAWLKWRGAIQSAAKTLLRARATENIDGLYLAGVITAEWRAKVLHG